MTDYDGLAHSTSIGRETSASGYCFLEPTHIGPYTLQVWRVSTDLTLDKTPTSSRSTKTKVRFTSYLPRGTLGVRLPDFTATLRTQTKCNDVTNISSPIPSPDPRKHKLQPSQSLAESPEVLRHDPSDYCSPFSWSRGSSGSPSTSSNTLSPFSAPTPFVSPSAPWSATAPRPRSLTNPSFMWQFSLYLDGNPVDPTEISEFKMFPWAKDQKGSWSSRYFTKEELSRALQDIISVVDPSAEISAAEILQKEIASTRMHPVGRLNSENFTPLNRHNEHDVNLLL